MFDKEALELNIDPSLVSPIPEPQLLAKQLQQLESINKNNMSAREFLLQVPKAELHLHSTSMADIFTTARLAWEISNRTDKGLQKQYDGSLTKLVEDFLNPVPGDLSDYLVKYDLLKNYIILDLAAVKETSYKGAQLAFKNGVRILEIRTSIKAGDYGDPRSKDVMSQVGYTAFDELCARIDGFRQAEKESNERLSVFLIISFRRQEEEDRSMALLDQVLTYRRKIIEKYGRDYIVGVDIAGSEYQHKAKKFRNVFRRARNEGLKVTAHAGEETGAGEGSIWQAINSGAQRIGHGTSLYKAWPQLPEDVRHKVKGMKKNAFILSLMFGTTYEMCLSSNVVCGAEITSGYMPNGDQRPVAKTKPMTEYKEYPAMPLIALGSLVYQGRSIIMPIPCTDGIYTLNTCQAREYGLASETFDWGIPEILAISRYSIRHSFAPDHVKAEALKEWRVFAARFLTDPRFSTPDEEAKRGLHTYRQLLRERMGIDSKMIESISKEVHSSDEYLTEYLYERFHRQNSRLEV